MHALKHQSAEGRLLTVPQIAKDSNLGIRTVRRIAEDSGALRKIGRSVRVDQEVFFEYVKEVYSK